MTQVAISVVTTLYCSERNIDEFYSRIKRELERVTDSFEILFVNDGSPDGSLERALDLHRKDPCVEVIDLSRNFGHHKAMMTGLRYATGDLVFMIDSDLEEAPELLGKFRDEVLRTGADVVYGVQTRRKGSAFEAVAGHLFYKSVNWLSRQPIPESPCVARLMTRRYVKSLLKHREQELYFEGVLQLTGFDQRPLPVTKLSSSPSTYTLAKRMAVALNAVTSLSDKPLIYIFYSGALISAFSFLFLAAMLVGKAFYGAEIGWPSLFGAIALCGGLTLLGVGTVGLYLAKVFLEVKKRPYTLIRKRYLKRAGAKPERIFPGRISTPCEKEFSI